MVSPRKPTSAVGIQLSPTANALDTANAVRAKLADLQSNGQIAQLVEPFGFKGETVTAAKGITADQLCKAS